MDRKHLIIASLSLAFVACGKDDPTETGDTNNENQPCGVEVESTYPAADATDFYYRASVEFNLTEADPEMTPSIALTAGGTAVAGATEISEDGETIYFIPTDPLLPGTDYTATLTYCTGDAALNFRTSELGGDLGADITGKTYALDIGSARILQPAAAAGLLQQYASEIPTVLIGVTGVTETAINFIGAVGADTDPPSQDMCTPTIPMPESDFTSAPYFQLGPGDMPFSVEGISVTIYHLMVSGTFAPDGSYFGGATLQGEVDARDVASMIPDVESADDVCELTKSFGAPCEPCSLDGASYCLTLMADQIKASEVAGLTLTEIVTPGPECE